MEDGRRKKLLHKTQNFFFMNVVKVLKQTIPSVAYILIGEDNIY
jgi:hypothetical protein